MAWNYSRPHQIAISPDGTRLLMGPRSENGVDVWDIDTATRQGRIDLPSADLITAQSLMASHCCVPQDDRTIYIVDLKSSSVLHVLHLLDDPADSLTALHFSPDGRRLLTAATDHALRLFDVETGELQRTLRGHTDEVFAAIFHPDGTRIFSGGRDRTI